MMIFISDLEVWHITTSPTLDESIDRGRPGQYLKLYYSNVKLLDTCL